MWLGNLRQVSKSKVLKELVLMWNQQCFVYKCKWLLGEEEKDSKASYRSKEYNAMKNQQLIPGLRKITKKRNNRKAAGTCFITVYN